MIYNQECVIYPGGFNFHFEIIQTTKSQNHVIVYGESWVQICIYNTIITTYREPTQYKNPGRKYVTVGILFLELMGVVFVPLPHHGWCFV